MDTSVLLNWIFGGGLLAALTALVTLGPTVRKAKAEAEKAKADAETVRIDNTEHATRILIENIVEPLKKELSATRREMARLRKAIDGANDCLHRADCPVLHELRELPKTDPELDDGENRVRRGQRKVRASGAGDGGPPASALTLKIPVPDLLALPAGASYHGKNGQAGVDVTSRGDTLVVTSTCDSLQRLVLWYEEELTRIRGDTVSVSEVSETEFKQRFNPVKIALIAFIAGMASGIVLTVLIKRRLYEK